jgi:hypothetical protein
VIATNVVAVAASSTGRTDWTTIWNVAASIASMLLAITAIQLSFQFYRNSDFASQRMADSSRKLEGDTGRLEALFNQMHADMYPLVTEAFNDRVSQRTNSRTKTLLDELKQKASGEIAREIDTISQRLDVGDEKIAEIQKGLTAFFDQSIDRAGHAPTVAMQEALDLADQVRDYILSSLAQAAQSGSTVRVKRLVSDGSGQFSEEDLEEGLVRLHTEGVVMWSTRMLEPETQLHLRRPLMQ